jgi:hypothetical protein
MFPYFLRVLGLWLFALTVGMATGLIVFFLILVLPALGAGSSEGAAVWGWYAFLPAIVLGLAAWMFALVTTLRKLSALGLFAIPPYTLDRSQTIRATTLSMLPIAAIALLLFTPLGHPVFKFFGLGTHKRLNYHTTTLSKNAYVDPDAVRTRLADIAKAHGLTCGACSPTDSAGRYKGKGLRLTYEVTEEGKLIAEIETTKGGLYPGSNDRADRIGTAIFNKIAPLYW